MKKREKSDSLLPLAMIIFLAVSGSSPKLTSPQTADITALQSLYGS